MLHQTVHAPDHTNRSSISATDTMNSGTQPIVIPHQPIALSATSEVHCFYGPLINTAHLHDASANNNVHVSNASRTTHPETRLEILVCAVLVLVAVRFALWTMMAELCFSVDDFIRAKRVSNCYMQEKKN